MNRSHFTFLLYIFLILIICVSFYPILRNEFVNFDDYEYVIENPHVNSGPTLKNIKWAFTKSYASNWHPLTWISHMVDSGLYGLNPGGHHLTSLLLHLLNTLLLFLILLKITGKVWSSVFVAALFAIHPLHVESVAWVSERKDVLSTFFFMLTLWAYAYYAQRPHITRYVLVFFLFGLGLMSKPMLVTLPFLLLLLDYWPLDRIRFSCQSDCCGRQIDKSSQRNFQIQHTSRLIVEKIPLFILSALSCSITFFAQKHGGVVKTIEAFPLYVRLMNAVLSYVRYMKKMIWPSSLAVLYPYPVAFPIWQILGAGLLLIGLSMLVVKKGRQYPYLPVGWLWYLGSLIPVIGLVQVGLQSMADRYTYVSVIGLFIIISWGIPDLISQWPYKKAILSTASCVILSILLILTWSQSRLWQNSVTLLKHTVEVTNNNYLAYNGLGVALVKEKKLKEGIAYFYKALRIKPDYAEAHNNLGLTLVKGGRFEEAIAHYQEALKTTTQSSIYQNNLGIALLRKGNLKESILHFSESVRLDPNFEKAHNNLGVALMNYGKSGEAIKHYKLALGIKSDYAEAQYNLGTALEREGKFEDAKISYYEALKKRPDYARAHHSLGNLLAKQSEFDQAAVHFRRALHINPNFVEARFSLALIHALRGDKECAFNEYEIIKKSDHDLAALLFNKIGYYSDRHREAQRHEEK